MNELLNLLRSAFPSGMFSLANFINGLPFLILFLWIGFVFFIMVYFSGGVGDLSEKLGPGSLTRLQLGLGIFAGLMGLTVLSLAIYLVLRPVS